MPVKNKKRIYKQKKKQSQKVIVNINTKSSSKKRTYKKKETTKPQHIIPNNYNMPSFIINHQIPQIQQPTQPNIISNMVNPEQNKTNLLGDSFKVPVDIKNELFYKISYYDLYLPILLLVE